MKILIAISGIIGVISLSFRVIGIITEFPFNNILLISGLILLFLIFTPLILIDKHLEKRKIEAIVKAHKNYKPKKFKKGKKYTKGWGMNNSPFRERKSGVTWTGGNVKGAVANRQSRRRFLN